MTRMIGLAVLLLPLLEIAGFILVSRWIGLPGVLLAVIAGAVGGLLLLQRTGLNTVTRLRQALSEGREPGRSLIDGACFAAAGLLFIIPGFVSDLVAFALVLPWTRHYLLRRMAGRFETRTYGFGGKANVQETIIETEFTEVEPDSAESENRRPGDQQPGPPLIDLSPDSKS
jgi:UPF0716 protein FxsA